jgi:AraC-like DNA-binding protein
VYESVWYDKIRHIHITLADINYRDYHEHNDYEVFAVIGGRAKIKTNTREFQVAEGCFAVFNSRAAHQIDARECPVVALVVQFSPYFCREYYPHARRMMVRNANAADSIEKDQRKRIMAHICRMALHYFGSDRLFELKCIEDLARLMVLIAEHMPCEFLNPAEHHSRISRAHKIDKILSYLETRYQHPIRLEEVAESVNMSPAYLSHFVTKNLGIGFHDYLTDLRFEHALRMIDRDLPLGDISAGSGFSDLKYMNKAFTKKTGMTAAQYREKFKDLKIQRGKKDRRDPGQVIYSEEQSKGIIKAYLNELCDSNELALAK